MTSVEQHATWPAEVGFIPGTAELGILPSIRLGEAAVISSLARGADNLTALRIETI